MCWDEVLLKENDVVRLRTVQLVVDGKEEEKVIEVVWRVTDGMDCCHVGFHPCHMVRRAALYNRARVQVTRVLNSNPADCDST